MKSASRLVFLYVCFVTWVLAAVVEGCGRTELDIAGSDGSVSFDSTSPDRVAPDANGVVPGRDAGAVDARVGDGTVVIPPMDASIDVIRNCSPLTLCNGLCANTL